MPGGGLSAPMYHLLERPALRTLFADASKTAIGGFYLENGVYWRHELDPVEQPCFFASSKAVAARTMFPSTSLNCWEWWCRRGSLCLCRKRPSATGDCVLLRRDNEAAVDWVRRCRGGREPRSGELMRLLGALELSSGWHFDEKQCGEFWTSPLMVSPAGIATLFSVTCTPFALMFRSRLRTWGRPRRLSVLRCWPRAHAQRSYGLV